MKGQSHQHLVPAACRAGLRGTWVAWAQSPCPGFPCTPAAGRQGSSGLFCRLQSSLDGRTCIIWPPLLGVRVSDSRRRLLPAAAAGGDAVLRGPRGVSAPRARGPSLCGRVHVESSIGSCGPRRPGCWPQGRVTPSPVGTPGHPWRSPWGLAGPCR